MITWKDLTDLFPFGKSINHNYEHMLDSYEFIWSRLDVINPHCIYIAKDPILDDIDVHDMNLILLTDSDDVQIKEYTYNCMLIKKEYGDDVYKKIKESFNRQNEIRNKISHLTNMLANNEGLQKMADELSNWLERPIGIIDNTYRFLVRSKSDELDTYVEEKDRNYYGLTQERLEMLLSSGIIDETKAFHKAHYYEVENFTIYHLPLFVNSVNVAILGIPGSKKLGIGVLPKEYEYELDKISTIFSLELAKTDLFSMNGKRNLPYMFSYVLEQEPEDFEEIKERMKLFDYTLLPNMFLLSIPYANKYESTIATIADALKRVFFNSIYLIRQNELLFLITRPEGKEISEFELDIWNSQLKGYGLHAGLSNAFTTFKGIRTVRLKEANLALAAGMKLKPNAGLYCFEEYQVDAMIMDLIDNENLSLFCYSALMKLKEFDEYKDAGLMITLKEYIKNSKKPREVCEALFIHKNTLYKRLGKIQEIMDCDLNNPEIIMKIQLTFHILGIMEKHK